MQNLSLRTRLLAWLILPAIIIVFATRGTLSTFSKLGQQFEGLTEQDLALVTALDNVKYHGTRMISSTYELILDIALGRQDLGLEEEEGDAIAAEIDQFKKAEEAMWGALEQFQTLLVAKANTTDSDFESDAEIAESIQAEAQDLVASGDRVLALQDRDANLWEILEVRMALEASEAAFLSAVDEALDEEISELRERQEVVQADITNANTIALTAAVISLAAMLGISHLIYRSINNPLKKLRHAATELSQGHLDVRTGVDTKDELGQLAKTLDHMANDLEISISELEEQTVQAVVAREQAERSDSVKSQFLASVSHELRTPLNAVLNFTQFVSSGMMGEINERQTEALNKVYNSAAHLLDLINDVLDISKIEANSLQLFIEENVNLKKELTVVIDSAESSLKGRPVRLHVDIPEELPLITGDRQRIRQIMLNLMGNACKFTEEGDISLKVSQENGNVTFTLSDTGPGITLEDQATLFDPFQQGKAGLKHGGTGLGLPITKRLIEAHGGDIHFETEVGIGTTFIVHLPVQSHVPVPTPA